jgi:hypothetical protein
MIKMRAILASPRSARRSQCAIEILLASCQRQVSDRLGRAAQRRSTQLRRYTRRNTTRRTDGADAPSRRARGDALVECAGLPAKALER